MLTSFSTQRHRVHWESRSEFYSVTKKALKSASFVYIDHPPEIAKRVEQKQKLCIIFLFRCGPFFVASQVWCKIGVKLRELPLLIKKCLTFLFWSVTIPSHKLLAITIWGFTGFTTTSRIFLIREHAVFRASALPRLRSLPRLDTFSLSVIYSK